MGRTMFLAERLNSVGLDLEAPDLTGRLGLDGRQAFATSPGEPRRQPRLATTPGEQARMYRRRGEALMGEVR